jgi:hypothetical protein
MWRGVISKGRQHMRARGHGTNNGLAPVIETEFVEGGPKGRRPAATRYPQPVDQSIPLPQ